MAKRLYFDSVETPAEQKLNDRVVTTYSDKDGNLEIGALKSDVVAECSTDPTSGVYNAATINNIASTGVKLFNGLRVSCKFTKACTVSNPKFKFNGLGEAPFLLPNQASGVSIGSGCWEAGAVLTLEYCTFAGSTYWLIVGHEVASKTNNDITLANGTTYYNKQSVDTKLSYKAGDVISMDSTEIMLAGCVTGSTQSCYFTIHFDKDIPANCTLTLTKCVGAIRGNKGYVNGSSNTTDWLSESGITTNLYRASERLYSFRINKSSALTNVDNNTPVNFYCKLSFKVS